jgi:hypothetical protein
MTKRKRSGQVNITFGDVGPEAQVAIGDNIKQTHITDAERLELRRLFDRLAADVEAQAPTDQKAEAVATARELEASLTGGTPQLDRTERAKNWLLKHLPGIAGTLTGTFVNPILGKLVEASGDALAAEFKRRFLPH